jgi:hypothetical protein
LAKKTKNKNLKIRFNKSWLKNKSTKMVSENIESQSIFAENQK